MRDGFSDYHPVIGLAYFSLMLGITMFVTHPICQIVSVAGAVSYLFCLRGVRSVGHYLLVLAPMILLTALLNPAFNHRGMTILAYFPNGNPLTAESILYGLSTAMMLSGAMLWFACFSQVMTSDKLMYLFGKLAPALSLLLTMALRMVPHLSGQLKRLILVRKGLGQDLSQGSLWQRGKLCAQLFSALVTWALENAVETADAMKSRGYGLAGRTAFSPYRWQRRDKLGWRYLVVSGLLIVYSWWQGDFYFKFYPLLAGADVSLRQLAGFGGLAMVAFWPTIFNAKEAYQWKRLQSKVSPSLIPTRQGKR